MAILFHEADVKCGLRHKRALKRWIQACVLCENKTIGSINIVFCSDKHLLELNQQHLSHDYYTDIITFDYSLENTISGDLYISIDRVKDNAKLFKIASDHEAYRVIIHGVMHLCGYKDKTKKDAATMRKQEEKSLLKLRECLGLSSFT